MQKKSTHLTEDDLTRIALLVTAISMFVTGVYFGRGYEGNELQERIRRGELIETVQLRAGPPAPEFAFASTPPASGSPSVPP